MTSALISGRESRVLASFCIVLGRRSVERPDAGRAHPREADRSPESLVSERPARRA